MEYYSLAFGPGGTLPHSKGLDIVDRIVIGILTEFQPITYQELVSHVSSYPYGLVEDHTRDSLKKLFEAGLIERREE